MTSIPEIHKFRLPRPTVLAQVAALVQRRDQQGLQARRVRVQVLRTIWEGFIDAPRMQTQMDKNMEHEMDTGVFG